MALFAIEATGQTERQILPSDLKQQTIVTEPVTISKGFFRSGIAMAYGVVDKYFNPSGNKEYFMNSAWGSSYFYLFTFQYGITSRLMADVSIPLNYSRQEFDQVVKFPEQNTDAYFMSDLKGKGIGDCYLTMKYQIVEEKNNPVSLTGSLDITVPTGQKNPTDVKGVSEYNLPTGNGFFSAGTRLSARGVRYPYSYTAYAGYVLKLSGSRLINATDLAETEFKDGNAMEAGGSFNFHLNEWIANANELNFYYRAKGEVRSAITSYIDPAWAVSYETRLVFQIGQLRIGEAVRIPLKGKNVSADPQYVMIMQYIF